MSNSKKKMDVTVTRNMPWGNGKEWVKVKLKTGDTFIPSFEDLFRIVQAIAYCEDRKYPTGEGRRMVARFLQDAVYSDDWSELARQYKIPIRCGTNIVRANGANLPE